MRWCKVQANQRSMYITLIYAEFADADNDLEIMLLLDKSWNFFQTTCGATSSTGPNTQFNQSIQSTTWCWGADVLSLASGIIFLSRFAILQIGNLLQRSFIQLQGSLQAPNPISVFKSIKSKMAMAKEQEVFIQFYSYAYILTSCVTPPGFVLSLTVL